MTKEDFVPIPFRRESRGRQRAKLPVQTGMWLAICRMQYRVSLAAKMPGENPRFRIELW